jgi:hypothetical protein
MVLCHTGPLVDDGDHRLRGICAGWLSSTHLSEVVPRQVRPDIPARLRVDS